jgi:RNA polymerase sigma factor (sigma-70 family)
MEAALSLLPRTRAPASERELEELRPLGLAFLRRRFSGSISAADAEDAVAEVVIRLHRRIEAGRAPDNLRAAFFTSVRNAAIDQLRARASRPTVALEAAADAAAADPSPAERAEERDDSVRLREVIGRMRPNYREALLLRFGAGLTVPEIAERLELSLPAAKKLVLRATEQARRRLAAIEGEQFCPEMQELARRSLIDRRLAGLATEAEQALLRTHFEHCGHCKSFLTGLHRGLHDLGSGALLAGIGGERLGVPDHLARLFEASSRGAHVLVAKTRLGAYKAGGLIGPGDGSGAGALAGGAQKIVAICGAGAATTACLATGIVGPGVGAIGAHTATAHPSRPPQVRQLSEAAVEAPATTPTESLEPEVPPSASASPPTAPKAEPPTPPEQVTEEFGVENEPEPAPSPEPSAAPAAATRSAAPAGAGAGGSGGGAESFGFGG